MNRLKKLVVCGMAVALSLGMVACGNNASKAEETVIATVNGKEIYQKDYDALYTEYLNYFGGSEEAAEYLSSQKSLMLEELVTNEVLFQKAEELGIKTTPEEIEEAYQKIEEQYGKETVEQMLASSSMTEDDYKVMLEEQLTLGKLQEIMIEGNIEITDEMIKKYYEDNIADYTTGAGANMKHVLVLVSEDADDQKVATAEAAVKEIQAELANGMSFDDIYKKYSADDIDRTLYIAEDLGFVQYDEPNFDTAFLAGVKNVAEGEVSEPIKSSFGYHFVKVDGISEEKVTPLEEAKENIQTTLKEEEEYKLYTACLEKWTEEANVVTYEDRIQ